MFDKIKKGAQASIDASKKAAEVSIDAGMKAKDQSIKYGKKYIRKKAIENIREKLEFAQKKESDFTKEQMRKMIAKEEKKIIKSLGITSLNLFYATIMKEKSPELSAKFHDLAGEFAYAAARLDSKTSSRSIDESQKNMIEAAMKFSKSYIKDGKDNWTKTGSYFQGSYIEKDDEICKQAEKNIKNL
jgi:hypothetical protein